MKPSLAFLACVALLGACTPTVPPVSEESASSSSASQRTEGMVIDGTSSKRQDDDVIETSQQSSEGAIEEETSVGVTPAEVTPPVAKTIRITTDNWNFSPSMITLKKGEKVTVKLVGKAGIHGFAVPELGINQRVEAGKTVEVEILTDRTGTFSFFCSIPCGQGHRDMKGSIVIQP